MKLAPMNKKGNVSALPGFFQVMMLVVIFVGLTFIVLDKFVGTTTAGSTANDAIQDSSTALYDYGVGFLGLIILVTMIYLIISIVSGRKSR